MKSQKTKQIIGWVLTGLVSFPLLGSAMVKLTGNEEALRMAAGFGLDAGTYTLLGVVELLSVILFIIPRTGMIGTLLLASFMGGAIATHLEHGLPVLAPCIVQTFMLLVAFYRFPELRNRFASS